jgi:hypothetical protein
MIPDTSFKDKYTEMKRGRLLPTLYQQQGWKDGKES